MWYYTGGTPVIAGAIIVVATGGLGYALITHLLH
jgi:hypothetical protein